MSKHSKNNRQPNKYCCIILFLIGSSILSTTSLASRCPTELHRDNKGYWTSNTPPGWKSITRTPSSETLDPNNFGGTVYSSTNKRIACVYRSSKRRWVALLSNINHPFNEDDLKGTVWKYVPKHKDSICGKPDHGLHDCEFDLHVP